MSQRTQALLQQATTFHKSGQLAEAEARYQEILSVSPGQLDATFMLGILAAQTDREPLAVELLSEVCKRDPNNFEAARWLAGVLSFLRRYAEAEPYAQRAVRLRPAHYDALLKLATVHFGLGKFEQAANSFRMAMPYGRGALDAHFGLATTFLKLGDPFAARKVLRSAVKIQPSAEALLKLGEISLACERPEEAIECAQTVLADHPQDVNAATLLVRAYRNAQLEELEDQALQRLRQISPDDALSHTLYGRRLQALGKFPEAEAEFIRSIELQEGQGVAYYGVTAGRKIKDEDRELVSKMERVAAHSEMTQDERAHLHFALGKAYDNLGDYAKAMSNFDVGNALMREIRMGTRSFDRQSAARRVDQIISIFSREFIESHQMPASAGPVPIFIAGIMRSGTTLAEQILSCHPSVGGGGEQGFWRRAEPECIDYDSGALHESILREMVEQYLELLSSVAPGYPYVTDKNPANRMVYGLVQIGMPNSKIVHMRRNPVDVAISIYTTLIRTGAPFVGNKEDIVFALKEHERLTEHWRSVLPTGSFLEVEYEALVRDSEATTRSILEFIGLEWSEACLRPEDNLRTVVTPSFWQVRQPVYSGSMDRWKRYEPWLGPFAELMK